MPTDSPNLVKKAPRQPSYPQGEQPNKIKLGDLTVARDDNSSTVGNDRESGAGSALRRCDGLQDGDHNRLPPASEDSAPTPDELVEWQRNAIGYLHRLGAPHDLSEDLASEGILRLLLHLCKGGRPVSSSAYVFRIVHNLWVDQLRQASRDRHRLAELVSREMIRPVAGSDESIAMAAAIGDARSRLPLRHQQALVCSLDLDMNSHQIAMTLNLPSAGAAAVLTHRARRALADLLLEDREDL